MLIVLAIAIGFVLLVWSADIFVKGAAAIAQNLGVSPALVGLTIVSIGTSSPEILVSISAAFAGAGKLAIGNAIGSNIANIGLVLGKAIDGAWWVLPSLSKTKTPILVFQSSIIKVIS